MQQADNLTASVDKARTPFGTSVKQISMEIFVRTVSVDVMVGCSLSDDVMVLGVNRSRCRVLFGQSMSML